MKIDLHTHSTFSDGTLTPNELLQKAVEANISVLSITDHDAIGAYAVVRQNLPPAMKMIAGAELSSEYAGKDVHILLYGFEPENKKLCEYLQFFQNEREKRAYKILQKIRDHGYAVRDEELRQLNPLATSLGRPHIAKLLIQKGYFSSIQQVFDGHLNDGGAFYVPKYKATPEEIITLAHSVNALAVLAHPILLHSDEIVSQLLALPFDGIEVYHPKQDESARKKYLQIARKHNLLVTGGSDYHALPGRFPGHLKDYAVYAEDVSAFLSTVPYLV